MEKTPQPIDTPTIWHLMKNCVSTDILIIA